MTAINIQTITGINFPYTIYACDVYGNQCTLIATIVTSVPPENIIILPSQFNNVAAVGIKVIYGVIHTLVKPHTVPPGPVTLILTKVEFV